MPVESLTTVAIVGLAAVTVMAKAALVLVLWPGDGVASPLYMPTTLAVPVDDGVKVALQLAVPTGLIPWASVHGDVVPNPPVAVPETAKLTVPVGVVGVVVVSFTVAVQTDCWSTVIDAGLQETVVVVACACWAWTVIAKAALVLPA